MRGWLGHELKCDPSTVRESDGADRVLTPSPACDIGEQDQLTGCCSMAHYHVAHRVDAPSRKIFEMRDW
jgi:hypothetical protein